MHPAELSSAPRYGTLWARAVLRPFAEQVVNALVLQPGETVLDLSDDDGTTAGLLQRRGIVVRDASWRGATGARDRVAAVVAVRGGMSSPPPPVGLEDVNLTGDRQTLVCAWVAAPHEAALRHVFGLEPLEPGEGGFRRWPDVVRFDTVDHLWAAALARADVGRRTELMSPARLISARQSLAALLSEYLTADAALRIPAAMALR